MSVAALDGMNGGDAEQEPHDPNGKKTKEALMILGIDGVVGKEAIVELVG